MTHKPQVHMHISPVSLLGAMHPVLCVAEVGATSRATGTSAQQFYWSLTSPFGPDNKPTTPGTRGHWGQ